MRKSIYEEALEIIDKNIFELPDGFAVLYEIRKRIKQAQKQEKLLKLYRELMTVKDELISLAYYDDAYYFIRKPEANLEKQIKELEKQIKELEKQIKEVEKGKEE